MPTVLTTAPRTGSRIVALGAHRPTGRLTNTDVRTLATAPSQVTDQWITARTGIRNRMAAAADEGVVVMGVEAGAKAIASGGIQPGQVETVLLATSSMPSPMPNGSAAVAAGIGAMGAAALDVNAACSGFCYALAVADSLVRSGISRHVLVVASERMREWTDPRDLSTSMIFADGAGAALVGPAAMPGVGPVVWGSDGGRGSLLTIPHRYAAIHMEGQAVFRWAITELVEVLYTACERAGIKPSDLRAFVPHQANLRIVERLGRALNVPDLVIARDVIDTGNTSAASIPLALTALREQESLPSGSPVLLMGYGAGLTFAAQVVTLP